MASIGGRSGAGPWSVRGSVLGQIGDEGPIRIWGRILADLGSIRGPFGADLGPIWGLSWVYLAPIWGQIDQVWADSAEFGPHLAKLDKKSMASIGVFGPESANCLPESAGLGPKPARFDQTWPGVAGSWPEFGKSSTKVDQEMSKVGPIWPEFGQIWATWVAER